MAEANLAETQGSESQAGRRAGWRRRGLVLLILAVVLALLVYLLPGLLGRYLLSTELDALGIRHQGIDTLRIDLPTGRVWFGPVSVAGGDAEPGLIGEVAVDIDLTALWEKKAWIESLVLRGIRMEVSQDKQGLRLNGIPIGLPAESDETEPGAVATPWGGGLERLELHDSTLHFKGRHGVLDLEVRRLSLLEFHTWEPSRAGRFELLGSVNDIQLDWNGEARAFADPIELDVNSRIEAAALSKVSRFIGSLGLERSQGNYRTDMRYRLRLFDTGRFEGKLSGNIDLEGVDYAKAGEFALTADHGQLGLDSSVVWGENDQLEIEGQLSADLGKAGLAIADRTTIGMDASRIALNDLAFALIPGQSLAVSVDPDIDLQAFRFKGDVDISVDTLLDVLAQLQALSSATVSRDNTGLGDLSGAQVQATGSDLAIREVKLDGKNLQLKSHKGEVELDIASTTALSDVRMAVLDGTLAIGRFVSHLDQLRVRSGEGCLGLVTAGKTLLSNASAKGYNSEMQIDEIGTALEQLQLHTRTGGVEVEVKGHVDVRGAKGIAHPLEGIPEAGFQLGSVEAQLERASAKVDGQRVEWGVHAGAALGDLGVDFDGPDRSSFKLGELRVEDFRADQNLLIEAKVAKVDDLDVTVLRSLLEAMGQAVEDEALAEEQTKAEQQTEVEQQAAAEQLPEAETQAPVELQGPAVTAQQVVDEPDIKTIQALLSQHGYEPGPVDGLMGKRTALAIERFQGDAGLEVNGELNAALQLALMHWGKEAEPPAKEASVEGAASEPDVGVMPAHLRVGQLALSSGSVIRFRDDLVEPQVKVETVFKQLAMTDVDTEPADRPTQADLLATINDFTQLELSGQFNGLKPQADLDLAVRLEDLELSNYSPYVFQFAGVYLESGQLDTEIKGKADKGALEGNVQLGVNHLAFRPLSEENAADVEKTVGFPLETAVSLLQDDDGRIDLSLPVAGTLAEPDVDISSAVNKAIGGVLKKVFPPTLVASLLSNVGKEGDPGFAPIEFAPGSAEMSGDAKSYAEDVAEFLAEHPKLALKICGRATPKDRPEGAKEPSDQALQELAVARKRTVRGYLIEEKDIDPKQIPECRSTYDAKDEDAPRVEIDF